MNPTAEPVSPDAAVRAVRRKAHVMNSLPLPRGACWSRLNGCSTARHRLATAGASGRFASLRHPCWEGCQFGF